MKTEDNTAKPLSAERLQEIRDNAADTQNYVEGQRWPTDDMGWRAVDDVADLLEGYDYLLHKTTAHATGEAVHNATSLLEMHGHYGVDDALRAALAPATAPAPQPAAPIVAIGTPSNGPSKCSPLSCDGCPKCKP